MKPVIIGAGLAGLSAALALAPLPVILIAPHRLGEDCSSAWAQGGIAAAIGADDHADFHAADSIKAGAGLNDAEIVRQVTQDAPAIIARLIEQGVAFDRDAAGALKCGLEAAHSRHRIIHAADATGAAVMRALVKAVRAAPSIEIIENASARELLTEKSVTGVVIERDGEQWVISTRQVVLATGGAAALWRDTTNPHRNWGQGLALAARAGAALADLEFMQFHPTAIDAGRDPMPLASEALRGEGAVLVDETGARFTPELQPRDIVARAIFSHRAKGHATFLDARPVKNFAADFPTIHAFCVAGGIDPARDPIPVRPAAHYHMGGVKTDAWGRTNVPGLWACGEVASTGLHGANRLASNSLLEAARFGMRVAEDIRNATSFPRRRQATAVATVRSSWIPPGARMREEIRAMMSEHVGVVRHADGLRKAVELLAPLAAASDMAFVGLAIAEAALRREESRGAHYREDFKETLPEARHSHFRLTQKTMEDA